MEYKSIVIVISLFIFGILEIISPFFQYHKSILTRIYHNLILGLINIITVNFTIAWLLNWVWQQRQWTGFMHEINSRYYSFIISFLLLDFYMYFWHRFMHTFCLGWRFHLIHHTDKYMNISTAYRFHVVEVILSNISKICLIYIFGIPANVWLFYESLFAVSLVFHHSNFGLPLKIDKIMSYLIVTPNYHRAHHSQLTKAINSNYSSLLTIWDLIFKTRYYPPVPAAIKLGLPEETRDLNFISLLKLPFTK